ncbi:uncharacterized protein LOC134717875 [Mytilus trossulus]|uniref:uncharacterized protein LOC134717875 n=1 Tax=Mytilus trossulus TaxID=6551 RepID=UPI0030040E51
MAGTETTKKRPKREMKENKQLVKRQLKRCRLDHSEWSERDQANAKNNKGNWSECDDTTNTLDPVMTLRDGEEEEWEPIIIVTLACTKFELGCSFDVTFSECDPTSNMVTKSYIPTTDDDDSCENRSFEYYIKINGKEEKMSREKSQQKNK